MSIEQESSAAVKSKVELLPWIGWWANSFAAGAQRRWLEVEGQGEGKQLLEVRMAGIQRSGRVGGKLVFGSIVSPEVGALESGEILMLRL
jgi:hypothetical protein